MRADELVPGIEPLEERIAPGQAVGEGMRVRVSSEASEVTQPGVRAAPEPPASSGAAILEASQQSQEPLEYRERVGRAARDEKVHRDK